MKSKKGWVYTAFLYIPALLILTYRYMDIPLLLDISLVVLVFGIGVISYKEMKDGKTNKDKILEDK